MVGVNPSWSWVVAVTQMVLVEYPAGAGRVCVTREAHGPLKYGEHLVVGRCGEVGKEIASHCLHLVVGGHSILAGAEGLGDQD